MTSAAQRRHIGVVYSLGGALSAAVYIFPYKQAGALAPPWALAWALLLGSATMNSVSAWLIERRRSAILDASPAPAVSLWRSIEWRIAAGLALLAVTGNVASAAALEHLPPAITTVLLRTELIFVTALGILLLKERPSLAFYAGALLALSGLCIMQLAPGAPRSWLGVFWGLCAAASFGAMQVLTRAFIHRIRPPYVNAVRLWMATALLSFVPGAVSAARHAGLRFWGLVALAALFGPFIGRLCIMWSLRSLAAAESALLLLLSPVMAFAIGYFVFGNVPRSRELLGGALMLCGIALPPLAALVIQRARAKTAARAPGTNIDS
ncbi:MAG TPA: DMT family transporter [Polyangiaceae bacterium]|nr:DMT family transporter [Polyangiaceae bacterium]